MRSHSGITFNYAEGYFWGVVCAVSWGTSPLFIRYGLGDGGIEESLAGGFVSYLVASTVIGLMVLLPGNIVHMREFDRTSAAWFAASGTLTCFSQIFRYMALAVAPLSVVAPILQTTVIFRLVFNWLINRQHEVFGASVITGTALSAVGVLALTVSVDVVAELVPLPGWLVEIARLRWP